MQFLKFRVPHSQAIKVLGLKEKDLKDIADKDSITFQRLRAMEEEG